MVNDPSLPFSVNRNDARSLVDQVADGLRQAIVAGRWTAGDEIPSSRELVPLLGVSRIVTKAALARLVAEGYVLTRHGLPPTVRDRAARQWRGHVVLVYPQGDVDYFPTMFAEELRLGLNRAGYLFTRASVDRAVEGGPCDFSLLDAALSRSVDLAIVFDNRAAIFRHLSARKIPYAAVAHCRTTPDGAVGMTRFDYEAAVPEFVAACRAAGVHSAVVLRWDSMMCDAAPALRAAGIAVRAVPVKPDFSHGKHIGVEAAGYAGFARLAASGRLSPDTVVFVTDDYLARGALSAMLAAGLRPPEDFRLAVWANAGLGPFFPRELSRMETDPRAAGTAAAAAAIAYLETGRYPSDTAIRPRWFPGETMEALLPPEGNRKQSTAIEKDSRTMKSQQTLLALFALFAANASAATLLYDFETDAERAAVPRVSNGEFEIGVTNGFATSGDYALSFVCKPWREGMDEWPSFTLPSPVADWRGYDRLVVDVVNAGEEGDDLCLFVAGPEGRIQNGLSAAFRLPGKGGAQWIVPLAAWPKTTSPGDIARIHFFVTRPQHFAVALDRLTLLREGEPVPAPAGQCVWRDLLPLVDADRREARSLAAERAEETAHARDYFRFREACAAADQTSPAFLLGVASSMEKVLPRGRFSAKALTADGLAVRLAGNEYESVQFLVAPRNADLENVRIRVEGEFAANVAVSPVGYVHTTRKPPYQVADGPHRALHDPAIGWWPDPILGFLDGVAVRDLDVQSFWIRVHCPAGQPAGTYRGALVVSADGVEPVRVPFAVRVNGFTLGRVSALPLAVAFAPCPTFQFEGPEGIAAGKALLADPDSPVNKWRCHEREWVDFLADYLIPAENLYHRCDTNLLHAVRRLRDEGRAGTFNLGYWTVPASTSDADMAAWREKTIPRLTEMRNLAAELGILDLAYAYGADEAGAGSFPEVAAAVRELKAALPGIPICTTAYDHDFGVGTELSCVDWFVPSTPKFDQEKIAVSRAAGHKVWWYISCVPPAPSANFFIECPGIEPRILMGAQTVRNRPDGFLYYATAMWNSKRCIGGGPFTDWDPRSWTTYHGDGSLTCAGPDGTPLPTIRLENFRDGLEDYAYAKLLEQKLQEVGEECSQLFTNDNCPQIANINTVIPTSNRASWARRAREALAVPREVAVSLTDFTDDPAALYRWRDEMADLIEAAPTPPKTSQGE